MKKHTIGQYKSIKIFWYSLILTLLFSKNFALANTENSYIDVYKTDQLSVKDIKKKFGKELTSILELLDPSIKKNMDTNTKTETLKKLREKVVNGIYSMGDFSYVDLSPITYPHNKKVYLTIDIVDKKDKGRLTHFLQKPNAEIPDPDGLIQKWLEYEKIGFAVLLSGKGTNTQKSKECPFHYCPFGFAHKELNKYKDIFKHLVKKNKQELVLILRNDQEEFKRASAALLLAHLENHNEIINLLEPSMFDSSYRVRNNAMHIIGSILLKHKTKDFSIKKALLALDFPTEADRSKALKLITALIKKDTYSDYTKRYAAHLLIDHLKLSQPNLHEPAYKILKKISGKNFGERDYLSWEQWAKSVQQKPKNGS